jgi:nucleoside-diphosphate-sugar epimerase
MEEMRIMVTGASGFVGRPLVAALLSAGFVVRAVTRRPALFPDSVESAIIPDLTTATDWKPILQGVNAIVHLAGLAHAHGINDDNPEFDQINWIATQRLAQAAQEAGVERLIFLSSVRAQTGASAPRILTELDEPHPTNSYGRSKLRAEEAIRASGVPFTIFRPVVIYGPNPKGNMQTLVRLAHSNFPLPFASFTSRRSVLGIDNLISAIVFALETPATINETYLLADSQPMTIGEILKILRQKIGRPSLSLYVPQALIRILLVALGRGELWSRLVGNLVVDTRKFQSLGWRPVRSSAEGLIEMLDDGSNHSNEQ